MALGGLTPASSAKIHLGLEVGKIVFTPMLEGIRCFLLIHTDYGLFNSGSLSVERLGR